MVAESVQIHNAERPHLPHKMKTPMQRTGRL